jgi:Na+-transporting NADH:ubiquinone oxidoreductase subunit NqrF
MINITTNVWKITLALSLFTAIILVIMKTINIANSKKVKVKKSSSIIEDSSSINQN